MVLGEVAAEPEVPLVEVEEGLVLELLVPVLVVVPAAAG